LNHSSDRDENENDNEHGNSNDTHDDNGNDDNHNRNNDNDNDNDNGNGDDSGNDNVLVPVPVPVSPSGTVPVIDYATFKRKLRNYSRRRQKLRLLFKNNVYSDGESEGGDETVFVEDFEAVLQEFEDLDVDRQLYEKKTIIDRLRQKSKSRGNTADNTHTNVVWMEDSESVMTHVGVGGGGSKGDTTPTTPTTAVDNDNDNEANTGLFQEVPYVPMTDNTENTTHDNQNNHNHTQNDDDTTKEPSAAAAAAAAAGIWYHPTTTTTTTTDIHDDPMIQQQQKQKRKQQKRKRRMTRVERMTRVRSRTLNHRPTATQIKIHRGGIMRRVSNLEREDVTNFLSRETSSKLSTYYQTRITQLQNQFCPSSDSTISSYFVNLKNNNNESEENDDNDDDNDDNDNESESDIILLIQLGKDILDLYTFCAINVLIVRQLLIRYDAFARLYEGIPMMEFYIKTVMSSRDDDNTNQLHQIFCHEEVIKLCNSYQEQLLVLITSCIESGADGKDKMIDSSSSSKRRRRRAAAWTMIHDEFQKSRDIIHGVIISSSSSSATNDKVTMTATTDDDLSPTRMADKFLDFIRKYFLLESMEDQLGWHLSGGGTNRGRNLTGEMNTIGEWKRQAYIRWSTTTTTSSGYSNSRSSSSRSILSKLRSWKKKSASIASGGGDGSCRLCGGVGCLGCRACSACGWNGCRLIEGEINLLPECYVGDYICDALECTECGGGGVDGVDDHHTNYDTYDDLVQAATATTMSLAATTFDTADTVATYDTSNDENMVSRQQKFNLFMSLAAGFLYCMNYYIVEPSSTMYVNALGAQDAAGGLLIGMMPIAAFLAAIVYSMWTNTTYRAPFLVSCCLMISGNIVYSAAFNYKSLPMALIGRFMTGLGGPKMIVRRYMADTTCLSIRTSINALFGMVIATGSALGPGCAIMLSQFDFIWILPSFPFTNQNRPKTQLWFNPMTGPGWFMALLWSVFTIALYWGFQEQERIGLKEKLQAEATLQLANAETAIATATANANANTNAANSKSLLPPPPPPPPPAAEAVELTVAAASDQQYNTTTTTGSSNKNNLTDNNVTLLTVRSSMSIVSECYNDDENDNHNKDIYEEYYNNDNNKTTNTNNLWSEFVRVSTHLTFSVRLCMGLLFAKVFVIEILVSCTSALSKNRYGWNIHEVGLLGCANGLFVIPLSILVGKLSHHHQDRFLMVCLLSVGICGLSLLIDYTDLFVDGSSRMYNKNNVWSVGPAQYVIGYFLTYLSIQSFEGIIGSALSKIIPTALATGTFNSGLLATLVDTFGRSCGDIFIAMMGFLNIRQLMNLLFIPGVLMLISCLLIVRRYYDLLAV